MYSILLAVTSFKSIKDWFGVFSLSATTRQIDHWNFIPLNSFRTRRRRRMFTVNSGRKRSCYWRWWWGGGEREDGRLPFSRFEVILIWKHELEETVTLFFVATKSLNFRFRSARRQPPQYELNTFLWHDDVLLFSFLRSLSCRLIKYCQEHQKTDVLVTGISPSENPFKENKTCSLL